MKKSGKNPMVLRIVNRDGIALHTGLYLGRHLVPCVERIELEPIDGAELSRNPGRRWYTRVWVKFEKVRMDLLATVAEAVSPSNGRRYVSFGARPRAGTSPRRPRKEARGSGRGSATSRSSRRRSKSSRGA